MRPPPKLVRRAVVDPLWIPFATVLSAVLLISGLVGLVLLPFGRRRVPRFAAAAALYLLADVALIIACAGLWLRYPSPARRSQHWYEAHARTLRRVLSVLVRAARPLLGFRVQIEQPLSASVAAARHPLLVLARHGGPGDSIAIAELLLSHFQRTPVIVLKESLRWDPGLDVILSRLRSCFLPANSAGQNLAGSIAQAARGLAADDAMLIFPEGGNWTPRRHRRALAKLATRGRRAAAARAAANPHVLPPQPAGALACLAARPDLEVVVVAHTGLDDLVSPRQVWRALPVTDRPLVMRWWHIPPAELPADEGLLRDWLEVQWAIVDSWIDARKEAKRRDRAPAAAQANTAGNVVVLPEPDGNAGSS